VLQPHALEDAARGDIEATAVGDGELLDWLRHTRGIPRGAELGDIGHVAEHVELDRIEEELASLGIRESFDVVWAAEASGVDEREPRLVRLRRTLVRADDAPPAVHAAAERVIGLGVGDVARHEVGHVLLFLRPRVARDEEFRRLFGRVEAAYTVGDPIDEVEKRMTACGGLTNPRYRRVVSLYAATHPHERFAEAVRIALGCRADHDALQAWARRHRTAPIVIEQLHWAASWLSAYGEHGRRARSAAR